MTNPFARIELKTWPDFLLAISGVLTVTAVIAMFAGNELAMKLSAGFMGLVFFGIAGKISHYKYRATDLGPRGKSSTWASGWRHSYLSDCFVVASILSIFLSLYLFRSTGAV